MMPEQINNQEESNDIQEDTNVVQNPEQETVTNPDQGDESLESLKEYKEKNTKANRELLEAMSDYPELRGLIADVIKGAPLTVAIARNIDIDDLKPIEGEPDYEEWSKSSAERSKKSKSLQEAADRYDSNINSSVEGFGKFCNEKNLDEEQKSKMLESIKKIFDDISDGLMGAETLEMIHKSLNFEKIIEAAKETVANEVGNKRIEEFRQSKDNLQTDGIPKLSDSGMNEAPAAKKNDFDEIIERSKQRFN